MGSTKLHMLMKTLISALGAITGAVFGQLDMLLNALMIVVLLDVVSGLLAAIVKQELSSKVGGKGIVKKILIFVIVAVAHQLDLISGDGAMLRNAAIAFYLWNEMLSILENMGKAGVPVPDVIRRAVEVLKDKADKVDMADSADIPDKPSADETDSKKEDGHGKTTVNEQAAKPEDGKKTNEQQQ